MLMQCGREVRRLKMQKLLTLYLDSRVSAQTCSLKFTCQAIVGAHPRPPVSRYRGPPWPIPGISDIGYLYLAAEKSACVCVGRHPSNPSTSNYTHSVISLRALFVILYVGLSLRMTVEIHMLSCSLYRLIVITRDLPSSNLNLR